MFLSVSPFADDHVALDRILRADTASKWAICPTFALECALEVLRENQNPIVIAEQHLLPGTWRDVLDEIDRLSDPPLLIVTSRLADDHLWAEALNVGVFDVLAKPFEAEEVIRTLTLAWRHWQDRQGIHIKRTKQRGAAATAA
jgi:DNA-binding response OmpR family regulator